MYIYSDKGGDSARNSPKNEPKTIDKNPFFAPKLNKNEVLSETAYVNQRFLPYFGREASIETLFGQKNPKKCPQKYPKPIRVDGILRPLARAKLKT